MTATMATEPKTVRLVIKTNEDLRAALKMEAAKQGVDMSELGEKILAEALAAALAAVQERRERGGKKGRA